MNSLRSKSKTIHIEIPQQEIWKTTKNYPGYTFSSFGRVYSYISNQFLTGGCMNGYIRVCIRDFNNEPQCVFLSRIIYMLFGNEPELLPYRQVDHIIREEKTNNNINNLRLATPTENITNRGKNQSYGNK